MLTTLIEADAKQSCATDGSQDVPGIPGAANLAQIFDAVVIRDAVYVVDLQRGHLAMHKGPRQPMSKHGVLGYLELHVAALNNSARYIASPDPLPVDSPRKQPSLRVVIEKLPDDGQGCARCFGVGHLVRPRLICCAALNLSALFKCVGSDRLQVHQARFGDFALFARVRIQPEPL
jgi:hypothetical protein